MALTEQRSRTGTDHSILRDEEIRNSTEDVRSDILRPSMTTLNRRLLVGWIVVLGAMVLAQPSANPNVAVPVWTEAIGYAFLLGFVATLFGLAHARPWALKASGVTAGLGVFIAVACAITDHHMGMWWSAELAAFTALGGMTLHAAARHRG